MATKPKTTKKIFFVRETPEDYTVDLNTAKKVSKGDFDRLLKQSKSKKKKAA